eukprot:1550689-Prorocentrum_lima.AAC.1
MLYKKLVAPVRMAVVADDAYKSNEHFRQVHLVTMAVTATSFKICTTVARSSFAAELRNTLDAAQS